MSSEENKSLVYGFLKSCSAATTDQMRRPSDAPDLAAELERDIRFGFSTVLAPDYIEHGPRSQMPFEELVQGMVWLRSAFPDLTYQAEDVIESGDKVVARYSAHGTHLGQFMDAPPSNKQIEINGIYIGRVANGKIAEGWYASSFLSAKEIFEQLRLFLLAPQAMASDPFIGTWKLNVAQSQTSDLRTMPKSEILKTEGLENGLKNTFDFVSSDGRTHHIVWSVKYDGKDYPTTGDLLADTVAITKIDANTLVFVNNKAGKEVARWRGTISKDGKIQTWTGKAKKPNGQTFSATWVYDKQ